MFARFISLGALLALLTAVGTAAAKPACCGKDASCCRQRAACCAEERRRDRATCRDTGRDVRQCCGSKASPTPPCCARGCDHMGRLVR
jgi:hypothetical protein